MTKSSRPLNTMKFGEYYLTRKVASGGMAELYRARKVGAAGFQKIVAIKTLYSHLASNQNFLNMFMDEANLACQLTHQNIVTIFDMGAVSQENHQTYFIAMEYVLGKNFAEILSRAREKKISLPPKIIAKIIFDAAEALESAHTMQGEDGYALNLVHRDVSPHNILISYEGEVKLVDFGIAKALSQSSVTQPGVLKGKFSYMSPEQAQGKSLDARSDVYSLGIVMWEALTGAKLFDGTSEANILAQAMKPEIKAPNSLDDDISEELSKIAMKCLAPAPEDRFQSAHKMSQAIAVYLHELGTYPGTYSMRSFMYELFGPEIAADKEMIRREREEVRSQLGQDSEQDLTVVGSESKTVVGPSAYDGPSKKKSKLAVGLGSVAIVALLVVAAWYWLMPAVKVTDQQTPAQASQTRVVASGTVKDRKAPKFKAVAKPSSIKSGSSAPKAPLPKAQDDEVQRIKNYLVSDNYQDALKLIQESERKDPSLGPKLSEYKSRALYSLGVAQMKQNPPKALKYLKEASKISPQNAGIFYQIGRAQTKLKNYPPAIDAYRKAIAINPNLSGANFNLGYILLQQNDFAGAKIAFEKVIELSPPYVGDAYVNLAVCYAGMNDRKQAVAMLRKALEVDPKNQLAKLHLAKLTKNKGAQ